MQFNPPPFPPSPIFPCLLYNGWCNQVLQLNIDSHKSIACGQAAAICHGMHLAHEHGSWRLHCRTVSYSFHGEFDKHLSTAVVIWHQIQLSDDYLVQDGSY